MQREVELDWIIHFYSGYSFVRTSIEHTDELMKIQCEW
jgi:hypothetical protein